MVWGWWLRVGLVVGFEDWREFSFQRKSRILVGRCFGAEDVCAMLLREPRYNWVLWTLNIKFSFDYVILRHNIVDTIVLQ